MLKKFRHKEYTDDGCNIYECLSCKSTMEIRYSSLNYCPNCGIKFEGQLEWENPYSDRRKEVERKSWKPYIHYELESHKLYDDGHKGQNNIVRKDYRYTYNTIKNPDNYSYFVKQMYDLKQIYKYDKETEHIRGEEYGMSGYTINYRIVVRQENKIIKIYPLESIRVENNT